MAKKIVFYDLETGGLDTREHPVIQIAAVSTWADTLEPIEEFEVKVQFDVADCSPEALEVNSFDPDIWKKDAVPKLVAMNGLKRFLSNHASTKKIAKSGRPWYTARMAGHNAARFDHPFLIDWFKSADVFFTGGYRCLCTYQMAEWFFELSGIEEPKNLKLGTLAEHFGISLPAEDAHDALADVRANVEVCKALREGLLKIHA